MALEKVVANEVGASAKYHRIAETRINFDLNQQTIVIKSYADESYRNKEKEQMAEIATKISRYKELTAKAEKTEAELVELQTLNIQELEAMRVEDLSMRSTIMTIPVNDDTRAILYGIITNTIPDFEGSLDVI